MDNMGCADPDFMHMLELATQGYQCAQILMILALEADSKENSDLVRAAGGLNLGLSDASGPCGALTGGCCFISYFAGKGDDVEMESPVYKDMLKEYTTWFRTEFRRQSCIDILDGDLKNMKKRCPGIVQASYLKVMEILDTNGLI
jgi:C_GCAxxG_C_C family probable redox protein